MVLDDFALPIIENGRLHEQGVGKAVAEAAQRVKALLGDVDSNGQLVEQAIADGDTEELTRAWEALKSCNRRLRKVVDEIDK